MISRNDIIDVITKCVGYDPMHSPKESEIIEAAWWEHFETYSSLTRDDILAAVTEYYRTPDRRWPQPANISVLAREICRVRNAAIPLPELEPASEPATPERRKKHMEEIAKIIQHWSSSTVIL